MLVYSTLGDVVETINGKNVLVGKSKAVDGWMDGSMFFHVDKHLWVNDDVFMTSLGGVYYYYIVARSLLVYFCDSLGAQWTIYLLYLFVCVSFQNRKYFVVYLHFVWKIKVNLKMNHSCGLFLVCPMTTSHSPSSVNIFQQSVYNSLYCSLFTASPNKPHPTHRYILV